MSAQATRFRLDRIYAAALVLHGLFIVALVALGLSGLVQSGAGADGARGGGVMAVALFLTGVLPALPSGIALLSWRLCRRRGWKPSPGHMGLSIAAAVIVLLAVLYVVISA